MPQRTATIGSLPEAFGMVKVVRRAPVGIIRGGMAEDVDQIRDLSNGGVDFAVELAGTIKAMETTWWSIRYGGRL